MKNWFKRNLLNIAILGAIALSIYAICPQPEFAEPEKIPTVQEPIETEKAETETEIPEIETEKTETETEIPEIETETIEEVEYFDVPLSHDLQDLIFAECEKNNIAPAIIIAMIERESSFRAHVLGDNGTSFGLMQIKEKYQKERMERLGCTDLLNPYENVIIGIDIVAELKDKNPDLYWVLMAYNGGQSYANKRIKSGKISNYALKVVERAEELTESIEN